MKVGGKVQIIGISINNQRLTKVNSNWPESKWSYHGKTYTVEQVDVAISSD